MFQMSESISCSNLHVSVVNDHLLWSLASHLYTEKGDLAVFEASLLVI
jgi:hypothetical protein